MPPLNNVCPKGTHTPIIIDDVWNVDKSVRTFRRCYTCGHVWERWKTYKSIKGAEKAAERLRDEAKTFAIMLLAIESVTNNEE